MGGTGNDILDLRSFRALRINWQKPMSQTIWNRAKTWRSLCKYRSSSWQSATSHNDEQKNRLKRCVKNMKHVGLQLAWLRSEERGFRLNFCAHKHCARCILQDSQREALKITMIFQWYLERKIPNFHDNSERHKTAKHRVQQVTYGLLTHLTGAFKKSGKIYLRDLLNGISVNYVHVKYIYLSM